jgi:outer membrane protein assembly factor BamB
MHMLARFNTAATLILLVSTSVNAGDWAQWRGPNRDAKSTETDLLDAWPENGPPLAWKVDGLGGGYSSVAIADGKIYTLGDLEDGSYLLALNESDGSLVWKQRIGDPGGHKSYPGPRSTPTVDGGSVFALNQHADLVCVDAATGELSWSTNLVDDFGGRMMSGWKYSESPLVDGDRVICTPGGEQGTVLALQRSNGEKIWQTAAWTDAAAYSSVIIATIDGVRQYIQLTGESVAGIQPDTGEILWRADRPGKTAVVATPVVAGNIVFVTSSYGVGCNAFRVNKDGRQWTAEELYASQDIANHHGGVVLIGDHVYGSSGGTFRCLEVESGDLEYKERSVGKGATVYADGHFYLRSETGPVALIEVTPDGYREVSQFDQPDRSDDRAWPHPVIANGKLYLRDQDILLCYDIQAN